MTSVRLDHITKAFGSTLAVNDIDLTIAAGELFFLLGPSGCGKSTLLRLIAGLHEPTSGRVLFNDRDVTPLGTDKRNAVMCFQSYALWPHMSVAQNVRFGLEIQKTGGAEAEVRVREALQLVQLAAYADRKPNELSGGQQQRVALARALVVRPACLLLDEPLSNLDAKLRLDMRSEIRRICRASGLTAIYVTHDQKEALSIADRMAILNAGRVEQLGNPQEIYLRPKNRFIANFMGETNFISGSVDSASDGRVVVRTTIGQITSSAPSAQAVPAGMAVTLSIRPEVIRIGEAPSHIPNRYDAVLHDTLYLGEVAQHLVNFGDNGNSQALKVFELNPKVLARDEARQQTPLWFDPADVVVLKE